jgi:hypothetical protein
MLRGLCALWRVVRGVCRIGRRGVRLKGQTLCGVLESVLFEVTSDGS